MLLPAWYASLTHCLSCAWLLIICQASTSWIHEVKCDYLHLAEAGFIVMAPGQASGRLLPLQRLLHLLSCEEHLNVHQILKIQEWVHWQRRRWDPDTTGKQKLTTSVIQTVSESFNLIPNAQYYTNSKKLRSYGSVTSIPLCLASLTAVL